MADNPTRALVERAGRVALADELYDLRCALSLAEYGERMYTPEQHARIRERVAEVSRWWART